MHHKILIIESTPNAMQGIVRQLGNEPYQLLVQTGVAATANALSKENPSAVIIGESLAQTAGLAFAAKMAKWHPQTSLVILGGAEQRAPTNDEAPVWRLASSWHGEEMRRIVRKAVLRAEQKGFSTRDDRRDQKMVLVLQGIVERQRAVLAKNSDAGEEQSVALATYKPAMEAVLECLEARVPGLRSQALLEAKLAEFLAGLAGSANLKDSAYMAAALAHSACLFGTPAIANGLARQRAVSNEAADAVLQAGFPTAIADAIRHQYENWDGSGPHKIRGDKISVIARCVKAAQYIFGQRTQGELTPSLDLANGNLLDPNLAFRLIGYIRSNQDPVLHKMLGDKQGSGEAAAS